MVFYCQVLDAVLCECGIPANQPRSVGPICHGLFSGADTRWKSRGSGLIAKGHRATVHLSSVFLVETPCVMHGGLARVAACVPHTVQRLL